MGTYYPNQISEKQLAANRANALKSTGPKTEEGKATASMNAFRHGATGQVSVKTDEDRVAHAIFTEALIADLKPEGPLEHQLAFAIADGHWRLNRIRASEDNIFALGHYTPAGDIEVDNPELHSALTQARVFLESSKALERLTLYEQRLHRTIEKDMAKMEQLQAKRRAEREAALEEAVQRVRVARFDDEDPAPEMAVNGFEFSDDEIEARLHRDRRLDQFQFHERNYWIESIEYPRAA